MKDVETIVRNNNRTKLFNRTLSNKELIVITKIIVLINWFPCLNVSPISLMNPISPISPEATNIVKKLEENEAPD